MIGEVKIKSIKKIKTSSTPVFDIQVKKNNNFILKGGNVVHNCKPYQYFKSTIYEKRVEMFYDKTLIDEIIDLERNINTGKIDHPQNGKKDSADAFAGSLYSASQHAEEYAYDFGENIEDTLNLNAQTDTRQQMMVDFEEELKNAFQYRNQVLNYNMQQQEPAQTIYIQDGIAVW